MLRVAFVLRSTEVQPEFFDLFTLSFISLIRLLKLAGASEDGGAGRAGFCQLLTTYTYLHL